MWSLIEKAKRIILVFLLGMLPLLFIFIQNRNQQIRYLLTMPIIEIAGGIEKTTVILTGIFSDFLFNYFFWANRGDELRSLRLKSMEVDSIKARLEELISDRAAILEINNVKDEYAIKNTEIAQVIARLGSPVSRQIRINKGLNSGVKVGDPVITTLGVVGQISNVSRNFSDLILITDSSSAFDAKLVTSNTRGILRGYSSSFKYLLELTDIDPLERPQLNEVLVTSGVNSNFPRGLPIGKTIEVTKSSNALTMRARIEPFVDFRHLDYVLVLKSTEKKI